MDGSIDKYRLLREKHDESLNRNNNAYTDKISNQDLLSKENHCLMLLFIEFYQTLREEFIAILHHFPKMKTKENFQIFFIK